eukprot:CAMPEP_0202444168 /NCGR_PEP_ID=MMETSP1360-20130828/3315_1 /ASSEMBLY_ACC=CAM_ASM_000848 /TAXON_ID=515479 /ORGANISM="Licmophora paradoxa, Strain CCMP2313" /LENGTH=176 /DNA_ID=CAMNT_0049060097 /DNA_START=548 /DNA_END=1078 /DNA_ORIENTATION=-
MTTTIPSTEEQEIIILPSPTTMKPIMTGLQDGKEVSSLMTPETESLSSTTALSCSLTLSSSQQQQQLYPNSSCTISSTNTAVTNTSAEMNINNKAVAELESVVSRGVINTSRPNMTAADCWIGNLIVMTIPRQQQPSMVHVEEEPEDFTLTAASSNIISMEDDGEEKNDLGVRPTR